MTSRTPASLPQRTAQALAAATVLAAGAAGIQLPHTLAPARAPASTPGPMLLAPMIGVVDTCLAPAPDSPPSLRASCDRNEGSAAALVESTLNALSPPSSQRGRYPLGYTLPVPLLQLLEPRDGDWQINTSMVDRVVRTIRDTDRPLILYLFSTHFASGAPLEKLLAAQPENLSHTRDGPLAHGTYHGAPLYNWNVTNPQTELSRRRAQAAGAMVQALCQLPAKDLAKIHGVTLLGEVHHLFPNFETDVGFVTPYRVSDYSAHSVAGFRTYLRAQFPHIARLNRVLGTSFTSFDEITPPSRDIRTEPLAHFSEHIDSFAHGSLPITGWVYAPEASAPEPWVHIYRNGTWAGRTRVNKSRQDVLQAKPEFADANTGWRWDLDFKSLPTGMHRIDVFLEQAPGQLSPLGTRHIAVMDRHQSTPQPQPQKALPASVPATASVQAYLDMPQDHAAYYYNPLVPLWHAFRGQQVRNYLTWFDGVVGQSCLAQTPRYTHQILPSANPGWDANKFAIGPSLRPDTGLALGVSLYGDATYGDDFFRWLRSTGHARYGVTEFHPLKAMDAATLQATLDRHAGSGARFLSFFLEPQWEGQRVQRAHNMFSLDPLNKTSGSDQLYRALQTPNGASAPQRPEPR